MSTYFREYRCKNCGESTGYHEDRCPMCGEIRSIERVESESKFYNLNPALEVLCGFCLAVIGMLCLKLWNEVGILVLVGGVPMLSLVMGKYYRVLSQLGPDDPEAHFALTFRQSLKILLAGLVVAIVVLAVMIVLKGENQLGPNPFLFPD